MSTTLALINLSLGDARSKPTLCPSRAARGNTMCGNTM
jgi:hypothetical protein